MFWSLNFYIKVEIIDYKIDNGINKKATLIQYLNSNFIWIRILTFNAQRKVANWYWRNLNVFVDWLLKNKVDTVRLYTDVWRDVEISAHRVRYTRKYLGLLSKEHWSVRISEMEFSRVKSLLCQDINSRLGI